MLWLLSSPTPCSSFMQRWPRPGKLSQLMCHQPLSAAKSNSFLPLSHVFCAGSSTVWGGAAADNDIRNIQGRSAFEPLLSQCLRAACASLGSCVSMGIRSILPAISGREFQSYQYRSVLCHTKQVIVLSAYLEICCRESHEFWLFSQLYERLISLNPPTSSLLEKQMQHRTSSVTHLSVGRASSH